MQIISCHDVSDKWFTIAEQTQSDDLDKLRNYFYNWRLKLNTTKTVCTAFHQTNRLADYELSITTMGEKNPLDKNQSILVSLLTVHSVTTNTY